MLSKVDVGRPIDNQLNEDFGRAKDIRNSITHAGKKISAPDARFVIQTVYKLLQYLGSTLELELALVGLKRNSEGNKILVKTEDDAVSLVREYFGRNKAAYAYTEMPKVVTKREHPKLRCDLILEFGKYRLLVETRLINLNDTKGIFGSRIKSNESWYCDESGLHFKGGSWTVPSFFSDLIKEMEGALKLLELEQGAIVFFVNGRGAEQQNVKPFKSPRNIQVLDDYSEKIKELENVQKYQNGKIFAIVINV